MTLGPLSPERLGAEGLARRELASGATVEVCGYRLTPTERAALRFIAALGGSPPRGWLDRVMHRPVEVLRALVAQGLAEPVRRDGEGVYRATLTPEGRMVAEQLPDPPPPRPHPLREALAKKPAPLPLIEEILEEHRQAPPPERPARPCREEECYAGARSRGLCQAHYMRRYRRGEL